MATIKDTTRRIKLWSGKVKLYKWDVNTIDDADEKHTLHIYDCVAYHNTHKYIHCVHACTHFSLFLIIHTHIDLSLALARTSFHHHGHPGERSLFMLIFPTLYYLAFFPLPFLPPSQSVVVVLWGSIDQTNLMEKWSIDQGNLMSVTARKHRLGLYLKSKDKPFLRIVTQKSVITNSKQQLTQKKSVDFYKDSYGDRNWNFVKFVNKVLQRWKNCGNFRVILSILLREEISSRIRTLFWNFPEEYRNCKMRTILRIFRFVQFAVLSHFIQFLKGCWGILSLRRAAQNNRHVFGTHIENRETFLQIHLHFHQHFILKN